LNPDTILLQFQSLSLTPSQHRRSTKRVRHLRLLSHLKRLLVLDHPAIYNDIMSTSGECIRMSSNAGVLLLMVLWSSIGSVRFLLAY
jgi:hypothetical protein